MSASSTIALNFTTRTNVTRLPIYIGGCKTGSALEVSAIERVENGFSFARVLSFTISVGTAVTGWVSVWTSFVWIFPLQLSQSNG